MCRTMPSTIFKPLRYHAVYERSATVTIDEVKEPMLKRRSAARGKIEDLRERKQRWQGKAR